MSRIQGIFTVAILFATICCVLSGINDNEIRERYMGVDLYPLERDCAMVGGICVQKDDCLTLTRKKGLCPLNRGAGVECCYELPKKAAPCQEHLGECMTRCHKTLQRVSTDCPSNEVCCVLV